MVDVSKLRLARAERRHYQPILDISNGVYNGKDYFPSMYEKKGLMLIFFYRETQLYAERVVMVEVK